MAQTPLSASSPGYATPGDLLTYVDARPLGDWASDTGARIDVAAFSTNAVLLAACAGASGEVESVVCRASRLLPVDLQALTGSARQFLKKIVCGRAIDDVYGRRHRSDKKPQIVEWAEKVLDEIGTGRRIFPTLESEDAGLIHYHRETVQENILRGGITQVARRYWGTRTDMIPPPPFAG